MYPTTIITWEDQSQIRQPEIKDVRVMPLYCTVITSDKGPEDWTKVSGLEFFNLYTVNNTIDFEKHGQALLQAGNHIQAGAELLVKRITADDATLANITLVANLKQEEKQRVDSKGNLLFKDHSTGKETTERFDTSTGESIENERIMDQCTVVYYTFMSASDCKTPEAVTGAINEALEAMSPDADTTVLPLFTIFDNGRGSSKKRIQIKQNYSLSRNNKNYFMYDMFIMEGNNTIDTIHFVLDPDTITNDKNMSIQYQINDGTHPQIRCYQYEQNLRDFKDEMIAACIRSGEITETDAHGMDLLFGTTKKQRPIHTIRVDYDAGIDPSIMVGQLLLNGDNGSFGDRPLEDPTYSKLAAFAFAGYNPVNGKIETQSQGVYDNRIYDYDLWKIDAILDANYPRDVKRAIEQLVNYREDCMYFRDMGLDCNTLDLINDEDFDNLHTKFAATYCTYYDIINPYSKKQVTVTLPYSLGACLVNTFNNGRSLPTAGIRYGYIISECINNTIGFVPAVCPGLNEKDELFANRINYANLINDELVVETLYTSQDDYTQLSFINNVLAVQQVIKVIRSRCPSIRYSFIDGDDLAKYKADVEAIISPYRSNFKKLELTYLADPYYTENKIFYATLVVQFRDFVQTEYFKIVAIGNNT